MGVAASLATARAPEQTGDPSTDAAATGKTATGTVEGPSRSARSRVTGAPRAVSAAIANPLAWAVAPWIVSLALGLVPNQTLRWIAEPAAAAVLGDEIAGFLVSRAALIEGPLSLVVVAVMLAAIVLAFYLYPVPLARSATLGVVRDPGAISPPQSENLRYRAVEMAVDIITAVIIHLSALDGVLTRVTLAMKQTGLALGKINSEVHDSYYFPSLAVSGIIILFVFLG